MFSLAKKNASAPGHVKVKQTAPGESSHAAESGKFSFFRDCSRSRRGSDGGFSPRRRILAQDNRAFTSWRNPKSISKWISSRGGYWKFNRPKLDPASGDIPVENRRIAGLEGKERRVEVAQCTFVNLRDDAENISRAAGEPEDSIEKSIARTRVYTATGIFHGGTDVE